MDSKLREAIDYVEAKHPLPRCPHNNALRDHAGERLEPPCGCRIEMADRPGLYICCMRTASKYYDQHARFGIVIGLVITCDNEKCGQPIEYMGGGWKNADAER